MIATLAVIQIVIDRGAFMGTMLMKRNDAVFLATHEVGEHRNERQEREKADNKAVPSHDPEQCAQHDVRYLLGLKSPFQTLPHRWEPGNRAPTVSVRATRRHKFRQIKLASSRATLVLPTRAGRDSVTAQTFPVTVCYTAGRCGVTRAGDVCAVGAAHSGAAAPRREK